VNKIIQTCSTVLFASILILAMYSIPNNIQLVFAHEDAEHFACWERVFNSISDVITVVETITLIVFLISSIFDFGLSLAKIPPFFQWTWAGKILSILITIPITFACYPELIPPPVSVAGTIHLDCNDSLGFRFKEIKNDDTTWNRASAVEKTDIGFIQPKLIFDNPIDGEESKNLPRLFRADHNPILNQIYGPWAVGVAIAGALGFKSFAEGANWMAALFLVLGLIFTALGLLFSFWFNNNWKEEVKKDHPNDAIAIHPWHSTTFITESTTRNPNEKPPTGVADDTDRTFNLGLNSHQYQASTIDAGPDFGSLRFNVYDSEPPRLDFGENFKEVKLEANAHFGFKVNAKTEPLIFLGTQVTDNCDNDPDVKYIGPNFFLLTSLKENQYAPWKVTDSVLIPAPQIPPFPPLPVEYYDLDQESLNRAINQHNGLSEEDFIDERTAQFSPTEGISFKTLPSKFATLKHLYAELRFKAVNELIEENTVTGPTTADVVSGPKNVDRVTDKVINIINLEKELEEPTDEEIIFKPPSVDRDEIKKILAGDVSSSGSQSYFLGVYSGSPRSTFISKDLANPNVFVDFQIITVEDRIPPNILVLENLAIGTLLEKLRQAACL